MEIVFKFRSYSYSELAQLYFPKGTKKSASVQLRRWILLNKKMYAELTEAGFISGQRILTPLQVRIIIKFLGEP